MTRAILAVVLLAGCSLDGAGKFIDARAKGLIDYTLQKHAAPAMHAAADSLGHTGDTKAAAALHEAANSYDPSVDAAESIPSCPFCGAAIVEAARDGSRVECANGHVFTKRPDIEPERSVPPAPKQPDIAPPPVYQPIIRRRGIFRR